MKNFNEYILKALNEKEDKIPFDKCFDINKNNGIISIKQNGEAVKNYINYLNKFEKKNGNWTWEDASGNEYVAKDKDLVNALDKNAEKTNTKSGNSKDEGGIPTKEDFEKMGKAVAYRTMLGLVKNEGNIENVARDVLKDTKDDVIKDLSNLPDMLSYAAAGATISTYLKKESEGETYEHLKNLKSKLIASNTRDDAIDEVKEKYGKEFDTQYKIMENAYNTGMKEQKEDMTNKPVKEWKDPVTGLPPEGAKEKWAATWNNLKDKGFKALGEKLKGLGDKITNSPHNLENDMARLVVYAVKGALFGASILKFVFGGNSSNFKKEGSKKKFDKVKKAIDDYKKKFDDWKKKQSQQKPNEKNGEQGQAPQQNASFKFILKNDLLFEVEEQNQEQQESPEQKAEKERQELLNGLNDLLYTEILPFYYRKLMNVTDSFEHKDNVYLLQENDNNTWSTLNVSNGSITLIEDTKNICLKTLKYVQQQLAEPMKEFSKESLKTAFNNVPNNIKYKSGLMSDFEKWINNLETETNLLQYKNIYNDKIFKDKSYFKTYNEFIIYLKDAIASLTKFANVKPLNNTELKFKEPSLNVGVKGIIINDNKKETEEDSSEVDDLKSKFENIQKEIESLNELNNSTEKLDKMDDVLNKLEEIDSKIQTTYNELWKIVQEKDNKDDFNEYEIDAEKTPVLQKIVKVKGIMSKLGIQESITINNIKQLILEAEEGQQQQSNETNDTKKVLEPIKKELKDLVDKKFEEGDINKYQEIKDKIKNTDVEDQIKDQPELLFAMMGKDEGESEEKEEPPVTEENAKKSLESAVLWGEEKDSVKMDFENYENSGKTYQAYVYKKDGTEQKAPASPFMKSFTKIYREMFNKWAEENKDKEDKKEIINILKLALGEKVEDNGEGEDEKPIEPDKVKNVDGDILKIKDNLKSPETVEQNLQGVKDKIKALTNDLSSWFNTDQGKEFKNNIVKSLGDNSSQIIPTLFAFNKLAYQKDFMKSFSEALKEYNNEKFLILLEDDNVSGENNTGENAENKEQNQNDAAEKIKEKLNQIQKLIETAETMLKDFEKKDIKAFNDEYNKWKNDCVKIYEELSKNEELKKLFDEQLKDVKDPYEKMCKVYPILVEFGKKKSEAAKGKPEVGSGNNEGGEGSGEGGGEGKNTDNKA